jgi:hypothetical protein
MAYEYEDAAPLTLRLQGDANSVDKLALQLKGRHVELSMEINNAGKEIAHLGFFAHTSFFNQLGQGEEHADKRFSDLKVEFGGKPTALSAYQRGFFLGKDITDTLKKAGAPILPENDPAIKRPRLLHFKNGLAIENWQGYVAYSWSAALKPRTSSMQVIRYQALPQFSLEEIGSPHFRQQVQQHCGNPDQLGSDFRRSGDVGQVLSEIYEIPIKFLFRRAISVDVMQPEKNWLGARPGAILVCGIEAQKDPRHLSGILEDSDDTISIMVISHVGGTVGGIDGN